MTMGKVTCDKQLTALLMIDPYNDSIPRAARYGAQARDDAALIRAHEKIGRTLTEEETVTLLRSLGFEISEAK
jgi:hypothetical protein